MILTVLPAPRTTRRAALATVEITGGMTLAHLAAGGALPELPWLGVVAALVFVCSLRVLRGDLPIAPTVAFVTAAQLVSHVLMTLVAPPAAAVGHGHAGHAHGHGHAPSGLEYALTHDLSWQMLAAHAAGVMLTMLVWRVRRQLGEVLVGCSAALPLPSYDGPLGVVEPDVDLRPAPWRSGAPRRGPPALLRCA